ncbi:MAG TPA: UDP-2,3-diacylglucosamine diphosphatase [Gemmatimonadaceae bacterium]
MLSSPCYVISDLHLGFAKPEVEQDLLRFLRQLPGRANALVINGDLFEFWFEWRSVIPRSSFRVLAALADLRDAGIDVLMIAGNHDCWGGDVLRKDVGIDYHVGVWEGAIAGWNGRIEHGDGLRPREDRRYRLLRRVLRHRWAINAFRWLHPDFGTRLATHSSHASRTYGARDQGRGLARIASDLLGSRRDLDLLIYGHSHVATLVRMPTGAVYANAGSWLDAPTFLRLTPERVELRQWNGSAEGLHLDALDRVSEKALA